MKNNYYEKVMCSQELPTESGLYDTNLGELHHKKNYYIEWSEGLLVRNPTWWLKPIDLDQVKADAWEEGNQITEKYWQDYDENGGNEYPTNPYKNEKQ